MNTVLALLFGLLFGVGLLVSGMTDPARVIGFLDIAGAWNPSLAFVMGGAVLTAAPLFALAQRRGRPLFNGAFEAPGKLRIDLRLIGGAALFGVGWGLAGLCPGPALVNFGRAPADTWIFVTAMAIGLVLGRLFAAAPAAPDHDAAQRSAQAAAAASD
ncbi:DUF6691 family protein [Terricaulis sp.]|uniref:DUF6691 family protein n=1 Tax=Terricaulis sp. TaxID=2768686 RepID=UPI00378527CD